MFFTIFNKEILEHIGSLKFVVAFVVVTILVITGLILGSYNYLEKTGDAQAQLLLNQKMLAAQSDWLSAGGMGVLEQKKPHVLSIIDSGIDNSLGRLAKVNTGVDTVLDESRNLVAPILALFGEVDLTFVVKIILSLFVILMTFDAISGEKERGTLKLALANSVPRHRLILAKMVGGFAVILLAMLLPLLIGMAFMLGFYPGILAGFSLESWTRLLLILLAYILFLLVFFAAGLLVSALSQRSSTSFVVLLMVWILFVVIVPGFSMSAAERLRPYEPYTVLQTRALKEIAEQRTERMKKYSDESVWGKAMQENKIPQLFGEMMRDESEFSEEVLSGYNRTFERQQADQISTAEALARVLSPASAMSFAVQNLAGSGWARHEEYQRQLRRFQNSFRDYVWSKIESVRGDNPGEVWDKLFRNKSLDVDQQNIKFTFQEESLGAVVGRSLWDFGVLALLAIVFLATAFIAFIRYDAR
jgi:ABC-type transport system involved in multi-copper enzyme maturation permease subunit